MTTHSFRAELWKHQGTSGWCFVTLPARVSSALRTSHGASEEGWGRLKTTATVGSTRWATSVWFDTAAQRYLLPVKADVRRKEALEPGIRITVSLEFEPTLQERTRAAVKKV